MSIKEQIQKDRIAALKSGDRDLKGLLDYILGEIQKSEKDPNAKADNATAVIQAYIKSQRDMVTEFKESRPEEATRIHKEIDILMNYMPRQLSEEEMRAEISELIAAGTTNKGQIMAAMKQKHGAAIDGRKAAEIAGELTS